MKYHINVKYLKYNARKEVNIASFSCQTDALHISDMFKLMSVSGLLIRTSLCTMACSEVPVTCS